MDFEEYRKRLEKFRETQADFMRKDLDYSYDEKGRREVLAKNPDSELTYSVLVENKFDENKVMRVRRGTPYEAVYTAYNWGILFAIREEPKSDSFVLGRLFEDDERICVPRDGKNLEKNILGYFPHREVLEGFSKINDILK